MAEENDQDELLQVPVSDQRRLLLFVAIGVVLIVVSTAATLMVLKLLGDQNSVPDSELADVQDEGQPLQAAAIYYPLKPTIIVNFNDRGRQRFLQAEVSLMVRDEQVLTAIEEHSTMLQHSLLMLFSGQEYSELQTAEGKELLRQQALIEVQLKLEQETGQTGVEQVLFTNLVMQ